MSCADISDEIVNLPKGRQVRICDVLSLSYASPDDTVILAGTIVEGIGSIFSDLDVYVITDSRPRILSIERGRHDYINPYVENPSGELHEVFDYCGPSGFSWNVEYWTPNEATEVFSKVREIHKTGLWRPNGSGQTQELSYKERNLVHRLATGIVLQRGPGYSELVANLPLDELCFILFQESIGGYSAFRDVVGICSVNDYDSAIVMLRELVSGHILGLTFLAGLSNPNRKWIAVKVKNLPESCESLGDDFLSFYALRSGDDDEKRRYIRDGLDLLDRIFDATARLLRGNRTFLSPDAALRILRADRAGREKNLGEVREEIADQYRYNEKLFVNEVSSKDLAASILKRVGLEL